MKKNKTSEIYWTERMIRTFLDGEKEVLDIAKELQEQYEKAAKEIEKHILLFYGKYQTTSGLDMKTIRKQLDKVELKDFKHNLNEIIEYAKEHKMDKDFRVRMKLLNIKTRISRLEELKTNIEFEVQKLAVNEESILRKTMEDIYEITYLKNIYNYDLFTGLNTSFTIPNFKAVEKLLSTPINIKNYAVGLYKNKNNLVNLLNNYIPQGLILGYNPKKVAGIASKALGTNYNSTVRLVRTEYNYVMNQATTDSYKACNIDRYQILAALDERTCTECSEMNLEIYDLATSEVGLNYPPFHPNCRCTTIPYFEPDEFDNIEFEGDLQDDTAIIKIIKNDDGTETIVPNREGFEKWKKNLK